MSDFIFWTAISFIGGIVAASFFEWTLHRYVMHRPLGSFRYPFRAHALVHHNVFKANDSYHLIDEKDKWTIPMAWWNGPLMIFLCSIIPGLISWMIGQWGLLAGTVLSFSAYYATYEYLHWCMHLPRNRHLERSGVFFRLNGHHLLHHRYMNNNFNVVLPLADLCLGTLLLRAKVHFAQATGPSVPDVQPLPVAPHPVKRFLRFVRLVFTGVRPT